MSKALKLLVALCLTISAGMAVNGNLCMIEPIDVNGYDDNEPLLLKLCIEGFAYYSDFKDGRIDTIIIQAFSTHINSVGEDKIYTTVPMACECVSGGKK